MPQDPRRSVALSSILALAAASGCGSSAPPLSVRLSPSAPQTIDQTQTVGISATLTNDRGGQGVSWTLSGPGSLSGATATFNRDDNLEPAAAHPVGRFSRQPRSRLPLPPLPASLMPLPPRTRILFRL